MKEVRVAIESFLFNSTQSRSFKLIKLRYCRLPTILGPAIQLIKDHVEHFATCVLSVLSVGRTAKFLKNPIYSTITDSSKAEGVCPNSVYFQFVNLLINKRGGRRFKQPISSGYHFSSKSSPFGDNAMETLFVELASLPQ
jgi:hypothetical protein